MTHSIHELPRRVLADDCDECVERAAMGLRGLTRLDDVNLAKIAALAAEVHETKIKPDDASWADMEAVDTLRLAARIVYRSGITEKVAR